MGVEHIIVDAGSVYLSEFCGCPYPCAECCDAVCCYTGIFNGGDPDDPNNYEFIRSTYGGSAPPVTDGCPMGQDCYVAFDPVSGLTGLSVITYNGNDFFAISYVGNNVCFPCV